MNLQNKKLATKKLALVLLAISFVALGSARGDGSKAMVQPATSAEVKIDNFTFQAPTMTVPAGTQVTWTNRDDIPHTIVSEEKLFKSKALDTDEKFSFTFAQPGTYRYFCSIHPKMTAEIVVK